MILKNKMEWAQRPSTSKPKTQTYDMHQTFHKRLKTNATGTKLLSFIKCNIQHGLRSSATNLKPGVTQTLIKSTNFCKIGNYIYIYIYIYIWCCESPIHPAVVLALLLNYRNHLRVQLHSGQWHTRIIRLPMLVSPSTMVSLYHEFYTNCSHAQPTLNSIKV